jgi:hypothetical protein
MTLVPDDQDEAHKPFELIMLTVPIISNRDEVKTSAQRFRSTGGSLTLWADGD